MTPGVAQHAEGTIVVGIDGYPKGWVGVALRDGRFERALAASTLQLLLDQLPEAAAVGLDIPIGLPDTWPRAADRLARDFVKPRQNSVFMTMLRAAWETDDFASAMALHRERAKVGFSAQAWALRAKVLEADLVARSDPRLHEVHPEVSFRAMAGEPVRHPKSTWDGAMLRRRLLTRHGIELPDDIGTAGEAGPDDVLDAAAAAWSASRIAAGVALSLPAERTRGSDGHSPAIWY